MRPLARGFAQSLSPEGTRSFLGAARREEH